MILKEYTNKDSANRNRVYVEVKCDNCGSIYTRQKRQLKEVHGCTPACSNTLKGNTLEVTCAHCKTHFLKSKSKVQSSKSGLVFCTRKCKDAGQSYIQEIQPEHYGKGDGKYDYRIRAIKEYGEVCQMCGFDNPFAIVVHHIDHDRANNELDNLVVLCANCHMIAHKGNFIKK